MIIAIMGVTGSGKTTIGRRLAERLGWLFFDGDDFHPPRNVRKMSAGVPLADDDRAHWLDALARLLARCEVRGQPAVLSCSALKAAYREQLGRSGAAMQWVYLRGSYETILERLEQRTGHYMPPGLLSSQFEALEEPHDALTVDISVPADEIVNTVIAALTEKDWRR
jgi:gluconokinase